VFSEVRWYKGTKEGRAIRDSGPLLLADDFSYSITDHIQYFSTYFSAFCSSLMLLES